MRAVWAYPYAQPMFLMWRHWDGWGIGSAYQMELTVQKATHQTAVLMQRWRVWLIG